ncbi:MAG: hypothetical protein MK116_14345, partial [Phycisphaerales bacterium]|nr:hypothetical protein [Phycisphaerales bacterium]
MGMREAVHVSVDTGGTFTDVVLQSPDGTVRRCKLLSTGAVRDRVCSIDDNRVGLADAARHGHDFTGYAVKRVGVPDSATVVAACVDGVLQIEQADEFTVGDIVELSTGEAAPSLGVRLITGTGLDKSLPPTSLRLGTTRGTNALLERQCASVAFFTTEGFRDLLRIGTQQRPDIFAFPVVIDPPIHEQSFEVTERVDATGQVVQSLDPEQVRRLGREALAAGCTSASVTLL